MQPVNDGQATPSFEATVPLEISPRDRATLRKLARQAADLAARPGEQEKTRLWKALHRLERVRPLVVCIPQNGWVELVRPVDLACGGALAQRWEETLRQEIFLGTRVTHDRLQADAFDVPHVYSETDWGMHETKIGGDDRGAWVYESPLRDYASDLGKLRVPEIRIDADRSARLLELAHEVFDGILPVRRRTGWYWTLGITWEVAKLRGLQQIMMDMYDHPEEFRALMRFVRDGLDARLDFLEENGLLALNYRPAFYEGELPPVGHDPARVRTRDLLGFAESQETVGVSPEMFEEFIFPWQVSLLERFAINHYGCCEPLDSRIDVVKRIPRLRRVTVSPWASLPFMAEQLGDRYIMLHKPHPAPLAAPRLDERAVRQTLRQTFHVTRDCRVEICLADTNTFGNNPDNLTRWSRIAAEEAGAI